jgi:oligogalacturonide lyase
MLTVSAERLCMHDSSFYFQNSHPYPCFTPDGKHVLYASDIEGYINLYLADIPDYDSLPYLDAKA